MDRKRNLESLQNDLFKDLSDQDLGRAAGGEIRTCSTRAGVTNVGKLFDQEFDDWA
jgi:hypothetical protein